MNKLSDQELEYSKKRLEVVLKRGGVIVSKTKAGSLAGLTRRRTMMVFDRFPELEELRKESLKKIKTTAMQNIVDIIEDKDHKDHYAATKEILRKYKTEFDEVLEANDLEGGGNLEGASISITFAKPED